MTLTKPSDKPRAERRPKRARLGVLLFMLACLACVWWIQRRDRLDRDLLKAVLEGETAKVHSLLQSGADANVHFAIFSARNEDVGFLEWLKSFFRSRRAERRPNDKPVLLIAASGAHTEIARDLIEHGADVNARLGNGTTALIIAAARRDPELPLLLLKNGASWKVKNEEGLSPLQLAARAGNGPLIKALLERGVPTSEKDKRGWTPLILAAEKKQDEAVRMLLERGANLSELNAVGPPPLLWAAQMGSVELVVRLWDKMVDTSRVRMGPQALSLAVDAQQTPVVEALLDRGVPVNMPPSANGMISPLAAAAGRNDFKMMELLLKHGADVRTRDPFGGTPLMRSQNSPKATELLLKHGADPNATDIAGRTPLMQCYNVEVARMLLNAHADPNVRDKTGATPIHYAFNLEISRMLLQSGADPNIADKQGGTPLMKAANMRSLPIVKLLLEHGARVNDADATGKTALAIAMEGQGQFVNNNAPSMTDVLKAKGAVAVVPKSQWRGTPPPPPARLVNSPRPITLRAGNRIIIINQPGGNQLRAPSSQPVLRYQDGVMVSEPGPAPAQNPPPSRRK